MPRATNLCLMTAFLHSEKSTTRAVLGRLSSYLVDNIYTHIYQTHGRSKLWRAKHHLIMKLLNHVSMSLLLRNQLVVGSPPTKLIATALQNICFNLKLD